MLISIIVPCYNNEDSLTKLLSRLEKVFLEDIFIDHSFQIIFVDDGSTDKTYETQQKLKVKYQELIKIVKLSRNFGSYNSFLAGMHYADGQINIYLHADLQDPPELISKMFEHYLNGYKLVIANREERYDKSIFSDFYHWLVKKYAIKNIPTGGFDLILFDSQLKEEIIKIGEKNTNNVYLITWLGFPYVNIPYKREERLDGKSQWTFNNKAKLLIDTIFSFTRIPLWSLRILFFFSIITFFTLICLHFLYLKDLEFYIILSLFNIFVFLGLMIIVEFLDRIHESVRNRPNFVVDKLDS